jgi:hypothetical protein
MEGFIDYVLPALIVAFEAVQRVVEGVANAFSWLVDLFRNNSELKSNVIVSEEGGAAGNASGGGSGRSYAQGTDYVPFDGLAYLHRGEAVIPANENSRQGITVQIIEPHIFDSVDADRLGRLVVTRLKEMGVNP